MEILNENKKTLKEEIYNTIDYITSGDVVTFGNREEENSDTTDSIISLIEDYEMCNEKGILLKDYIG